MFKYLNEIEPGDVIVVKVPVPCDVISITHNPNATILSEATRLTVQDITGRQHELFVGGVLGYDAFDTFIAAREKE